jgi:hypothetical protein
MTIRAALAQTDITPPLGTAMAGYSSRTHGCTDVEDPLFAQALVLADDSEAVAVLSLDVCSFGLDTKKKMQEEAAKRTDVPPHSIVISATHTHFGPVVDSSPWLSYELRTRVLAEYRENLVRSVAGLVQDACGRLKPVRLFAGHAEAMGITFNRRPLTVEGLCRNCLRLPPEQAAVASSVGYELWRQWRRGGDLGPRYSPCEPRVENLRLGVTDPQVTVLRVETEDGNPVAAVVNFACHPVCGGSDFYALSADYPGVVREVVGRELGAPALFLLGAAGDQVPAWREAHARRRVGQSLAGAVMSAWHRAEEISGPLRVASAVSALPVRSFPPVEELQARVDALPDPSAPQAWRERYELEMATRFGGRGFFENEVTAVAVGDWGLVTAPCEVLVEIGLRVKQNSPTPYTMFVSLAGENLSYMCTDEALTEGGYEATATALGRGAASAFIGSALEALRKASSASLSS